MEYTPTEGAEMKTYEIAPSGSEQEDHDNIEALAAQLAKSGYEPTDSEPGEWLTMTNVETGHQITIEIA